MELLPLARGYLEAEGYAVSAQGRDLLVGRRKTIAGDWESMYVWVPPAWGPQGFRSQEGPYLKRFQEVTETQPAAPRYFLVPTTEGLSTEFRIGALRWHRVNIRVPVQFFDTEFKWEQERAAASAARDLKRRGSEVSRRRVPQPFEATGETDAGGDILQAVHERMRDEHAKPIHVVIGPAGIGKSVFFEALYARLHDDFLDHKRAQRLSARPFPLLPEYLRFADAPTVRSLLSAYLQTDLARPLKREVFEWMLTNDLAT